MTHTEVWRQPNGYLQQPARQVMEGVRLCMSLLPNFSYAAGHKKGTQDRRLGISTIVSIQAWAWSLGRQRESHAHAL